MPEKVHTDRAFEAELSSLRDQLLRMAGRVEEMIRISVEAFGRRDRDLAERTIELDHDVNQAEIDIDEACLRVLAKRQPMGRDLRFLTLALKMVTDLERIGDLAVNVCERTMQLSDMGPAEPLDDDIPEMARVVMSMVHDALDAFVASDVGRAKQVIERDDVVDELYHKVFRSVLARMLRDPADVERGIHVQTVAKLLERMGDHGTNLAEHVVLLVRGVDVRHEGKL